MIFLNKFLLQTKLISIRFASFQIDNLLHPSGDFDYPVVLCNKDIPKSTKFTTSNHSAWDVQKILKIIQENPNSSIFIQLYNDRYLGVETLMLDFQPIRIYIEDTFVNVLLDLMVECIPNNLIYKGNFSVYITYLQFFFLIIIL